MTGSTFLPNGDLVVCAFNSRAVIVLDREFKEKSRLPMPHNVWGAAVFSETEIIVSLTEKKKLQIVEIVPTLKLKSSIKVGRKCFDVKTIDSKIFVVCTDDPGNGEVRVLDMDGNVIKQLGLNKDGTYVFKRPIHMASSLFQDKIYVSEIANDSKKVACMTVDGHGLRYFSYAIIKNPRGILLDENGNFLLCSNDTIYLVEADGNKHTAFLTKEDGLNEEPYALCYRKSDTSLVVTHQTKLLVFKLIET